MPGHVVNATASAPAICRCSLFNVLFSGIGLTGAGRGVICPVAMLYATEHHLVECMANITIIGPGAIGGTVAAWLAQDSRPESPDFKTEIWKKLCFNSAGALSSILLKGAVISRHEAVAQTMWGIVRECLAVALAEGARLDESVVENVVSGYGAAPADSVNSMHADRIAGRPMEIDARNGVIVRLGQKHGIPTPLNALCVGLLEAAQA
jgi:ketopantoate reductase